MLGPIVNFRFVGVVELNRNFMPRVVQENSDFQYVASTVHDGNKVRLFLF